MTIINFDGWRQVAIGAVQERIDDKGRSKASISTCPVCAFMLCRGIEPTPNKWCCDPTSGTLCPAAKSCERFVLILSDYRLLSSDRPQYDEAMELLITDLTEGKYP